MLFIVGLVLSAARAFVGMAAAGVAVAVLCAYGLLPFDCRMWLALAALLWLIAINILILRQWHYKPPENDVERGYRNYMRLGAVAGIGLGLLLSFRLAPWFASLV
jgi:hypothetical protein